MRNYGTMNKDKKQRVTYIQFYIAGDCVFSCKREWLPTDLDVVHKAMDIAEMNGVETHLVTWSEVEVELYPIEEFYSPQEFLQELDFVLKSVGISRGK